jgi:hypothetical protein
MVLLLQVIAVLVAGSVAALVWSSSKTSPQTIARAIVVLAVAFAYLAFGAKVWQTSESLLSQRSQWETLTPGQAAVAGTPGGVQGGFAEWIRSRLQPGQRFYLVPSATQDVSVYQWFTYRLLPNLATDRPQQADWLVFYGTSPRASGYTHLITGMAARYAPGYSIAKVRHAS